MNFLGNKNVFSTYPILSSSLIFITLCQFLSDCYYQEWDRFSLPLLFPKLNPFVLQTWETQNLYLPLSPFWLRSQLWKSCKRSKLFLSSDSQNTNVCTFQRKVSFTVTFLLNIIKLAHLCINLMNEPSFFISKYSFYLKTISSNRDKVTWK